MSCDVPQTSCHQTPDDTPEGSLHNHDAPDGVCSASDAADAISTGYVNDQVVLLCEVGVNTLCSVVLRGAMRSRHTRCFVCWRRLILPADPTAGTADTSAHS